MGELIMNLCEVSTCNRKQFRNGYCGSHCSTTPEEQNELARLVAVRERKDHVSSGQDG